MRNILKKNCNFIVFNPLIAYDRSRELFKLQDLENRGDTLMSKEKDAKQISSFIRIFSNYLNTIEKKMSNENLSFNEIKVMLELFEADNVSARDIEVRLDLDKSYTSRILKNLVDLELLEKEQSDDDKRLYYLSLTKKGKEVAKELYHQYLDILEEDIELLQSTSKNRLIESMKRIEEHYQKEKEENETE